MSSVLPVGGGVYVELSTPVWVVIRSREQGTGNREPRLRAACCWQRSVPRSLSPVPVAHGAPTRPRDLLDQPRDSRQRSHLRATTSFARSPPDPIPRTATSPRSSPSPSDRPCACALG